MLFIQVCIIAIYLQIKHLISDTDPGKTSPDSPQTPARLSKMDSFMSLGAPLKQFTSCVSGKSTTTKRAEKRSQSVRRNSFTRRKSVSRRRSLPCNTQKVPDSWLRLYQDELKRERYSGSREKKANSKTSSLFGFFFVAFFA